MKSTAIPKRLRRTRRDGNESIRKGLGGTRRSIRADWLSYGETLGDRKLARTVPVGVDAETTLYVGEPEATDSVWIDMRRQDREDAIYAKLEEEAAAREEAIFRYNDYAISDADSCAHCGAEIVEWEHRHGYRVWTHIISGEPLTGPDFNRRGCN